MLLGEKKESLTLTTFLGRARNLPILNKSKSRPRNNCDFVIHHPNRALKILFKKKKKKPGTMSQL